MRHSHHAAGSPAAQANLAVLAGWAPSRRGFLGSLLVAASATTAAGTAAALVTQSSPPATPGVSLRMAGLIAEFQQRNAAMVMTDHVADQDGWDDAAAARDHALDDLIYEVPDTLMDFAAKMRALAEIMVDQDRDLIIFRCLADDAVALAEAK